MENLQIWSNFDKTLSIVPTNEVLNWLKFGQNWTKIVEFSLIANFDASLILYQSVSKFLSNFEEVFRKNQL